MRLLGVDFGRKTIGLAVGDLEQGIASPLKPLRAAGSLSKDAASIIAVAESEQAEGVVVGIPLNPDYSGKMETIMLRLADEIRKKGWKVFTVDESLSSQEGAARILEASGKMGESKLHGAAATVILERYFNAAK